MTNCVALFRGINVGGKNILPMKVLRALLTGLGCEDVATYIQSGNAIFSDGRNTTALSELIATAVDSEFGFRPSIMVLTAEEFNVATAENPFAMEMSELKFVHAWFLQTPAANVNTSRMEEVAAGSEQYVLRDSAFYLYAPDGIGRSKLAGEVEKCLGVRATARNWRTISKIREMLSGLG